MEKLAMKIASTDLTIRSSRLVSTHAPIGTPKTAPATSHAAPRRSSVRQSCKRITVADVTESSATSGDAGSGIDLAGCSGALGGTACTNLTASDGTDTYEVSTYTGLNSPYTYSDMAGGQINNVTCNPPHG